MAGVHDTLERRLAPLGVALVLPDGRRVGDTHARVTLRLAELIPMAHLAAGQIGAVAQDYVEGGLDFYGAMRDLMAAATGMVAADPTQPAPVQAPPAWWRWPWLAALSRLRHRPARDARQVQFHYDVGDDFYALWLDPLRVYSCAYFDRPEASLAQAQEAKLEHICRKLRLREGERFLDIGAGWGALLLWAAQHHGARAHGITLSRNQHAHVSRRIEEQGLRGRVTVELCDYRELAPAQPFDKIASVGMVEHVGRARLGQYFATIHRLLRPGGLVLNHGITAAGTGNDQLGAGIGDFIERHVFPGGELVHVSQWLARLSSAGLEPLDAESLRPHYARTLWAWSDALEARLPQARRSASEQVVRAYRMYLAGSAMAFEQGWISLFQVLASRPDGELGPGPMRGAQSAYPFHRGYMYDRAQR